MTEERATILLVDDDPALLVTLRLALEREGHAVLAAASATEAIQVAAEQERPIHLLVTDVTLGGVTGPRLAASLRRSRPQIGVLYISGHEKRDLAAPLALGPDGPFLQKPFGTEQLLQGVRRAMVAPGSLHTVSDQR